jgi:hypothetical protein
MVIAEEEQENFLFQNPFKLMFNKYNKQCKVGGGHFNSCFYKKLLILLIRCGYI